MKDESNELLQEGWSLITSAITTIYQQGFWLQWRTKGLFHRRKKSRKHFSVPTWLSNASMAVMARSHCTGPGKGTGMGPGMVLGLGLGMMGLYIMLCTVHTTQGQGQGTGTGTNGLHTHSPFPFSFPVPCNVNEPLGFLYIRTCKNFSHALVQIGTFKNSCD